MGLVIGTNVLAEQAIGIADNNLVETDSISVADNDFAKFTASGLEGRSYAETRADLDLEAGTDFYSKSAEDTWRSGVTQTEMGYVDGVTSDIQTQLGTKGDMNDVVDDTTPQLGGNLDLNQFNINLDPTPSADHTWNGMIGTFTAGEGMTIGELCYLKSDGKMWQVDASAEATAKGMLAIATATISTDGAGVFLLRGFIRDDTWTWTVGGDLFGSETAGLPTQTAPSTSASIVRIIGQAYSADVIYFNPDNTFVEVA